MAAVTQRSTHVNNSSTSREMLTYKINDTYLSFLRNSFRRLFSKDIHGKENRKRF